MAINKAMRTVLKALSYGDINVQSSRAFANIKAIDPLKSLNKNNEFLYLLIEKLINRRK